MVKGFREGAGHANSSKWVILRYEGRNVLSGGVLIAYWGRDIKCQNRCYAIPAAKNNNILGAASQKRSLHSLENVVRAAGLPAKFDPFLSLDCARVEGVGAQFKERKGSNFAA